MKMDARRLIHDLGGQAEVRRKLESLGFTVSTSRKYGLDTIEKWCVRGSIPGDWLMKLSQVEKFDLSSYKLKPTKKARKK